jgi:hypothetical protein
VNVMERILFRQKKRSWIEHQIAAIETAQRSDSKAATAAGVARLNGDNGQSWWSRLTGSGASRTAAAEHLFASAGGRGSTSAPYSSAPTLNLSTLRSELTSLGVEMRQLEDVRRALYLEVHELRVGLAALVSAKTYQGRFFNMLGYFFSLYCIYKITMSSINIVFQRVNQMDPVSRTIQLVLVFVFDLDAETRAFILQSASFLLVGVLVGTQVRGFLLQLLRFFHAWSSALTSHSMLLLLAEMMGMYFVSSVLLMRMSVPLQYRETLTRALGDIKFHFYHHWFDLLFVVAAFCTIFWFYLRRQLDSTDLDEDFRPRRRYGMHPAAPSIAARSWEDANADVAFQLRLSTHVAPLKELDQGGGGSCLYLCIMYYRGQTVAFWREQVSTWLLSHPDSAVAVSLVADLSDVPHFEPSWMLQNPLKLAANVGGKSRVETLEEYCACIRSGCWATLDCEVQVLANILQTPIEVWHREADHTAISTLLPQAEPSASDSSSGSALAGLKRGAEGAGAGESASKRPHGDESDGATVPFVAEIPLRLLSMLLPGDIGHFRVLVEASQNVQPDHLYGGEHFVGQKLRLSAVEALAAVVRTGVFQNELFRHLAHRATILSRKAARPNTTSQLEEKCAAICAHVCSHTL